MPRSTLPGRLSRIEPLTAGLVAAAQVAAKTAAATYRERRRRRGYEALQPGAETPLWNELARECERHLASYGDKARLARLLGISRQRLHVLLVAKTGYPDAERALQLLAWLAARRRGFQPG